MESTHAANTNPVQELQARLAPQLDQARANLNDFNRRASVWIRDNPGSAILGACALGFFIGKIASR